MIDLSLLSVPELLDLHHQVNLELRKRDIVRSANNPTGDYAELLFSRAFGWVLNSNSSADADAIDENGIRYQIKCRRLVRAQPSRQLGFIRRLPDRPFDKLAAVLLDGSFRVVRGAIIPFEVVQAGSSYVDSVRAWRFILRDAVWDLPGVQDVTRDLLAAQQKL